MKFLLSVLLTVFQLNSIWSQKLPNFIVPCKADAQLNKCAMEHGKSALPHILKGVESLRIPVLTPLNIAEAEVNTNNLKMAFKNIIINGIETVSLEDIKINLDENNAKIALKFDYFNITTDYELQGRILLLNIKGKGPAILHIIKPEYICSFSWDIYEKEGTRFAKSKRLDCTSKSERFYIHLGNLFGDNKQIEDDLNKTLNENWEEVYKEIDPTLRETVIKHLKRVLKKVAEKAPYDEIFLS